MMISEGQEKIMKLLQFLLVTEMLILLVACGRSESSESIQEPSPGLSTTNAGTSPQVGTQYTIGATSLSASIRPIGDNRFFLKNNAGRTMAVALQFDSLLPAVGIPDADLDSHWVAAAGYGVETNTPTGLFSRGMSSMQIQFSDGIWWQLADRTIPTPDTSSINPSVLGTTWRSGRCGGRVGYSCSIVGTSPSELTLTTRFATVSSAAASVSGNVIRAPAWNKTGIIYTDPATNDTFIFWSDGTWWGMQSNIRVTAASLAGDQLTLTYFNPFATCAHLYRVTGNTQALILRENMFCQTNRLVVFQGLMANFALEPLRPGDRFRLCHGNNSSLCSETYQLP